MKEIKYTLTQNAKKVGRTVYLGDTKIKADIVKKQSNLSELMLPKSELDDKLQTGGTNRDYFEEIQVALLNHLAKSEYGKLQERIKELEALILTEEEAISLAIYVSDEIARLNRQACFLRESVEAGARIGNAYTKCSMSINDNERLLAKLQKIIDKRGCNED